LSRYVFPDHPAIREAEMYGWPDFDEMQDDELSMLINEDFGVGEDVEITGISGAEV